MPGEMAYTDVDAEDTLVGDMFRSQDMELHRLFLPTVCVAQM